MKETQAVILPIKFIPLIFCGPCIMKYLRNKDQQDAPETSFSLIVLVARQRTYLINTLCCIYSKLPPYDE